MKIVRILLAAVSLAVAVISAAILVSDLVLYADELALLSPQLAFEAWFWGVMDIPSAFFPLLLLLAGAVGFYLATTSWR
jgi:hypothetical protein